MRFYKKIISASLSLALLLTGSTNVFASETNLETNDETQAYVLNSFNGEQLASVSDFQINEHRVTFQHDGINYDFGISGLSIDTSDGMNVDGANSYSGAFMAEATISALVKGAPLMWSLYDVSYMNGTHQ